MHADLTLRDERRRRRPRHGRARAPPIAFGRHVVCPEKSPGGAEMTARKKAPTKDPRGGLTAAGREAYFRKEGAHLRPGVKGPADTPEKMKRKGSFLRRMFTHPRGPLVDDKGKPTRLALCANAWGEPVPKTKADAKEL